MLPRGGLPNGFHIVPSAEEYVPLLPVRMNVSPAQRRPRNSSCGAPLTGSHFWASAEVKMPSGLIATNFPAPKASPLVPGALSERLSIFVPSRDVMHHQVFWSLFALPMKAKTPLPAAPLRNQKAQPGTSGG